MLLVGWRLVAAGTVVTRDRVGAAEVVDAPVIAVGRVAVLRGVGDQSVVVAERLVVAADGYAISICPA
jgi:hypothetical protein